ncbi:MAG: hypothetical protein JWQ23_1233 [Herminiimonas sp.]|nr:hypothetical protein [Herminiimonas sp.]
MHQPHVSLPYNPDRLLDTLLQWLGVSSDKMLSRLLHLSPGVIRGIRAGFVPVRPSILFSMAECAGKSIDELRHVLGDRRSKARMSCLPCCIWP